MKTIKIGIIGAGKIGSELYRKGKFLRFDTKFILKSDGVYKNLTEKIDKLENYQQYTDNLDIVFLAIPTMDDGESAFEYLNFFLNKKIPVVTCEKGSLSNYFSELELFLNTMGYNATVGGGSRMLEYLNGIIDADIKQVHAIINGTLNFISSEISRGNKLEEVIAKAKKFGYVEPGANGILDVINGEIKDILMKTSILFNVCFGKFTSRHLKAKELISPKLNESILEKIIREASARRFIVSIINKDIYKKEDLLAGFESEIDKWIICGGFKNINDNLLYSQLIFDGVSNSLIAYKSNEKIYLIKGPGAGILPTVSVMSTDAFRLLQNKL